MATYTEHYNLKKPQPSEYYAIADFNGNADVIDDELFKKVDKVSGKGLSANDYTNADKSIVDGVTSALAGKVDKVTGKGLSTNDYDNTAKGIVDGVTSALAGKQDTLTFDNVPTQNSNNPVKSGGIYSKIGDLSQTGLTGDSVAAQLETAKAQIASKINKTAIQMGRTMFPSAEVGVQTVTVTFPTAFAHTPQVMVSWDDNQSLPTFFKYPLNIKNITTTGFTVQAERLNAKDNWWFRYIAVDNQ